MTNSLSETVEEDEDVVISGSELHEFLTKMGYSDFEVVSAIHEEHTPQPLDNLPVSTSESLYDRVWNRILHLRRFLAKDNEVAGKQLAIISKAGYLLDDHVAQVQKFSTDSHSSVVRRIFRGICSAKSALTASIGLCIVCRMNQCAYLAMLPLAWIVIRQEYSRWQCNRDLSNLIVQQTELYNLLRRGFRILNHNYKMNANVNGVRFANLDVDKLEYVQPIVETMKRSMSVLSQQYYHVSLCLWNELSSDYREDPNFEVTRFCDEALCCSGEVTYATFKQLLYRHLLIQSELLRNLATVAARNDPTRLYDAAFEKKLAHIIRQLSKVTVLYKCQLSRVIDSFRSQKSVVANRSHRNVSGSKWQDLYVHLHLTSRKIQRIHNALSEAIDGVEDQLDRPGDEAESLKLIAEQFDAVFKDCNDARDSIQLGTLLVAKLRNVPKPESKSHSNVTQMQHTDFPIVKDSEPQILDEVFEEYIREKYAEALLDDTDDDYILQRRRLDALLSKNLMSELKVVLIDKQRDMTEREIRALRRMKKPISSGDARRDSSDTDDKLPSGLDRPASNTWSERAKNSSKDDTLIESMKNDKPDGIRIPPAPPMPPRLFTVSDLHTVNKLESEHYESQISAAPPMVSDLLKYSRSDDNEIAINSLTLPQGVVGFANLNSAVPSFLGEETFIGSGENSEDEMIDGNKEDTTDNVNSDLES